MTGDTQVMKNAAAEVASEEKRYNASIEKLENLISRKLRNAWEDEASEHFITNYESRGRQTLAELDKILKEFYQNLDRAAEELDSVIKSLM